MESIVFDGSLVPEEHTENFRVKKKTKIMND